MRKSRTKVNCTKTSTIGFNGEPVFKADAGPYLFVTFADSIIFANGKNHNVEVIVWCSRDGEANCDVDANVYDLNFKNRGNNETKS